MSKLKKKNILSNESQNVKWERTKKKWESLYDNNKI